MTSRGYRAAKTRPLSHRAIRDQVLGDEMERLHAENYGVYGVRKMHHSDRGSIYVSLASTDRILELGGTPSVGSKGDSYGNALS